jgi:hypothetical protein
MTEPVKLDLTIADRKSPTWMKVEAHLVAKLALLRAKNDGALDPVVTATIRGRIAMLKDLIDAAKPPETLA